MNFVKSFLIILSQFVAKVTTLREEVLFNAMCYIYTTASAKFPYVTMSLTI